MAEDATAFFHFADDSDQLHKRITQNLGPIAGELQQLATKIGGISVPFNWVDQIGRQVSAAREQMARATREMLDPRVIGQVPSRDMIGTAFTQQVAGAMQQAKLEVARSLDQLPTGARWELFQSGRIPQLVGTIGESLLKDVKHVYEEMWKSLPAHLQQQMPRTLPSGVIPEIRNLTGRAWVDKYGNYKTTPGLFRQEGLHVEAAESVRLDKLWDIQRDDEGNEIGRTRKNYEWLEADQKALRERVRVSTATTVHDIREQERILSETLAAYIHLQNPYAKALGYTLNPSTGVPTRATKFGDTDITNPRVIESALNEIDQLGRDVEFTKTALANRDVRPILNSQGGETGYFTDHTEKELYGWRTKAGYQYLELLDETERRVKDLRLAEQALRKERDAASAAAKKGTAAQLAQAQQAQQIGVVPGFMHGLFGRGYDGSGGLNRELAVTNLATTAGSAIRYSAAYGGFYLLTRAMREGLAIFLDYQDSITDFEVALGESDGVTQSYTNDLMELSRVLGENVGAAYDAAARGARAFAGAADEATKKAAGRDIAEAALKIGVIADKPLTDATGDAVAIGTAFNLSASQANQLIPDALANAKREVGGDPKQIAQGLSNFAVAAQEMGMSVQEAANIIALVQSRTDQSGQAIATRLSRISQILSGSTGKSLAQDVNRALGEGTIDTNGTPAEQLKQYMQAYVIAEDRGQSGITDLIRSRLGGTANVRELTPLLSREGQSVLNRALDNAKPGAGIDEWERKTKNLKGTLDKIGGSIQNIVVLMANSDLFAPFAIGVKTIEPTLHLLESLLKVYEKLEGLTTGLASKVLPGGKAIGPLATTAAEIGAGVYAYRKFIGSNLAGNIANTTGVTGAIFKTAGAGGEAANTAATAANTAATTANTASKGVNTGLTIRQTAAMTANVASTGRMAAAANYAAAALTRVQQSSFVASGALGKLVRGAVILGAAIAVDQAFRDRATISDYDNKRVDLNTDLKAGDPMSLRAAADALDSAGASAARQLSWFADLVQGRKGKQIREQFEGDADALRYAARSVEEEKRKANAMKVSTEATRAYGDASIHTAEQLSEATKLLQEQGASATQRLRLLFADLMTPAAEQLGSWEQPGTTASAVLNAARGGYRASLDKQADAMTGGDGFWGRFVAQQTDISTIADIGNIYSPEKGDLSEAIKFDQEAFLGRIRDGIKKQGSELTDASLLDLAESALNDGSIFDTSEAEQKWKVSGDKLRRRMLNAIRKNVKVLQHQASSIKPLTPAELQELISAGQAYVAEADEGDPTDKARRLRQYYRMLIARRNATGSPGQAKADAMRLFREKAEGDGMGDEVLWHGLMLEKGRKAARETYKKLTQMGVEISDIGHQMREAFMADSEDLRLAAEARAKREGKSDKQIQKIRQNLAKVSFRDAGSEIDLLEQLFESLDKQTVQYLINYRKTQIELAREAIRRQLALIAAANAMFSASMQTKLFGDYYAGEGLDGPDPKDNKEYKRRKRRLDRQQKKLDAAEKALERSTITDRYYGDEGPDSGSDGPEDTHTAWQHAAMRAQALTNPNSSIAVAQAAMEMARADQAAAKTIDERISALQALTSAQSQLDAAMLEYKRNLDLLHGDMTDPVEQARDAARAARRKLRLDKARGGDKGLIAADEVAVEQSETALEKAKWDQKLSDMKTAEQLGRISHAQYIAYLERESKRMHRMNNKTRQQIDHMNEIDLELKSATEALDGMWNFGDINTRGLAYQMRRYRESVKKDHEDRRVGNYANQVAQAASMQQNVNILINGADIGWIKKILQQYLSQPAKVRTSQTRRR